MLFDSFFSQGVPNANTFSRGIWPLKLGLFSLNFVNTHVHDNLCMASCL